MTKVNVEIKIDSNSLRLEYCLLEGKNLNPKTHFTFKNGEWIGRFNNFPIENDNDLDLLIITVGNPNTNSKMTVTINGVLKGNFDLIKPFNKNGYGQFNRQIPL
tara:strand:- start:4403 stop:4714 length:312 start_codon:yes stop_codon:yes gene_type:complete